VRVHRSLEGLDCLGGCRLRQRTRGQHGVSLAARCPQYGIRTFPHWCGGHGQENAPRSRGGR